MSEAIRILFLADTHLGFDLPVRQRVARRRRGHDFLANYATALAPALAGDVDVVVHGGDVFDRARVEPSLAYQALEPLARIADRGVPVLVVPGNHERSRLPHERFAAHPHVHVFDRPRTFVVHVRGVPVAFAGFPSERREVRTRFGALLEQAAWREAPATLRLLCMHQCVEGATVGPGDYTFTTAADVVRLRDVPAGFAAVLSGHIHRHQVLTADLRGRALAAPVLYPGSIERTSLAEMDETKGYMLLRLAGSGDGQRLDWAFRPLPARPMLVRDLDVATLDAAALDRTLRGIIESVPADAVLRVRLLGDVAPDATHVLAAAHLRTYVPGTMNVDVRGVGGFPATRRGRARRGNAAGGPRPASDSALTLDL